MENLNYKVRRLDRHTWQLEDPFRTYLYLIEGADRAVLLDAGNGFSGLKETVASLTDKPVSVVLTHGHFDHTGAAGAFGECLIHEQDVQVLKEGFDRETRARQMKRFSELFGVLLTPEEAAFLEEANMPENLSFIKEGDRIALGGRTLEVIETPGHTRGSICLLDRENACLFSGDTVCNREVLVYFEHSASVEEFGETAEKLLEKKDLFEQIWPGHHECPLDASCIEDYRRAAEAILKNPEIGEKILLDNGYKLLYNEKSIGISYTESHVFQKR
ncbi:MAG: MBL fold metallo-hydrolase [Candidatus Limivivens sp.]|nr:MBL fold metallo-hydrolase [Candidatus Limivivens sp.]